MIDFEKLKQIVEKKFIGKISQVPPKFSNIKVNGKRAHELSRKSDIDFVIIIIIIIIIIIFVIVIMWINEGNPLESTRTISQKPQRATLHRYWKMQNEGKSKK